MATINITEAWLTRIAADEASGKPAALPPGVDRARYWDATLPGFGVIVGARFASFVVQHRVKGKQTLDTIGRYGRPGAGDDHGDVWTVTRARKEARNRLGAMSNGVVPQSRRAPTSGPTLRMAYDAHLAKLRKKGRAEATIDTLEKSMAYVEDWLDRPIADLTGAALIELHEQIKRDATPRANARNEKGAPLANRVITNVGTVWATLNKQYEGALGNWNPAKAVDKDKLKAKRVRLTDIADWYARVTGSTIVDGKPRPNMRNPIQRDGLVFALFTGLRSEDVRSIRFEHVDDEARTLRLPDPKGGEDRAFTIPLPKTCLDIIEQRRETNAIVLGCGDEGWAFPAVNSDGAVGPIGDLRQQVHAADGDTMKHTRFPSEDVHTLRRTYESVAHEAGVTELDQHVLTNHSYGSANVNQTYIAQHIDHLAKCQDTIEAALMAKIKPDPRASKTKRSRAKLHAV